MTSSIENSFHVIGPLGELIHRSPVTSPQKGQWRGDVMFLFDVRLNK